MLSRYETSQAFAQQWHFRGMSSVLEDVKVKHRRSAPILVGEGISRVDVVFHYSHLSGGESWIGQGYWIAWREGEQIAWCPTRRIAYNVLEDMAEEFGGCP